MGTFEDAEQETAEVMEHAHQERIAAQQRELFDRWLEGMLWRIPDVYSREVLVLTKEELFKNWLKVRPWGGP
jgi:hypothetical protein